MLARATAAGVDIASIIAGIGAPLAPVRFQILLQKAIEICQEVKVLGGQILAAIEKKDNEALSVLRAKHESNLLSLVETVRYAQWHEATKNREGIEISLQNAFQRFRHYERLLGWEAAEIKLPEYLPLEVSSLDKRTFAAIEPTVDGPEVGVEIGGSFRDGGHKINPAEAHELDLMKAAQIIQDAGTVLEAAAAVLDLIPELGANATPLGVGATAKFGGRQMGPMMHGLAAVTRGVGARVQHEANLAGKMASFDRREQDWAFQRKLAAGELTQLYKQLRAAELREHIANREYENHQKQLAQARDVEDFLTNEKRKTTSENFYLWMKREAQSLHAQCFQFAYDIAKKAERAFQHELGDPNSQFIKTGYMGGREGLFAGEKLFLDLKRMDMAYAELNAREFEITKHISLRDWFPVQLLQLRADGRCEISVPEALFDLDCPGHYFRRIKSVAVSIPCVTGPYASVNCCLRLLGSHVRTKAILLDGEWYPADPENPDTERFTVYPVAKDSIVTSSAQSDTGMFEPSLRDERYLPFEGAGVISKWAVELLGMPHQFDYDTISDVILSVRYTARAGAPQATLSPAVATWLKANSTQLFSMRHEFPSEWARFQRTQLIPGQIANLLFELKDEHFPYRMQGSFSNAKYVHLFGRTKAQQIEAELVRGTTSVGKTALTNGEGVIPPLQSGTPGNFNPRGNFELHFDTNAFEDLWVVVDWSSATP